MAKVFIDGQAGTAGLELYERLNQHGGVELLEIDPERRKDDAARAALMNEADVVFLCLPDAAATEAVRLVENPKTVVIDASTAHRVTEGWVYGLPELAPGQREAIAAARRIANPGCYATGFLLAVRPLIELHLADADYPFACQGLSGYSGAGKAAIAGYQAADRPVALSSPRQYGLSLKHKHLPEMRAYAGLDEPPLFTPVICDFYRGMAVSVPLWTRRMRKRLTPAELIERLAAYYADQALVEVLPAREDGFLPVGLMAGQPGVQIYVQGNEAQMVLTSVLDNLRKGAAGAAVQNMNLALGLPEYRGILA